MSLKKRLAVKHRAGHFNKFDFIVEGFKVIVGQQRLDCSIARARYHLTFGSGIQFANAQFRQIVSASKILADANRPHHWHHIQCQTFFNLVDQIKWLSRFAVHLVDKGDDGNVAHAADFEQLARPVFNALGPVDDHDGGIYSSECSIGVFRKVFVARRVQQVEHAAAIFKGHHRGHHRNATGFFNAHPV